MLGVTSRDPDQCSQSVLGRLFVGHIIHVKKRCLVPSISSNPGPESLLVWFAHHLGGKSSLVLQFAELPHEMQGAGEIPSFRQQIPKFDCETQHLCGQKAPCFAG